MLSNRWIGWLLVAVVTVMMSACGGGNGNGDDDVTNNTGQKKGAVLLDSPLVGVTYVCEEPKDPGDIKKTDSEGRFKCDKAPVIFKIGSLVLGSIDNLDSDIVMPQDILGLKRDNFTDPKLIALLRLLQSIDDDGNISEAITIIAEMSDKFDWVNEAFDADHLDDYADTAGEVGIPVPLVTEEEARRHLWDSMRSAMLYLPDMSDFNNLAGHTLPGEHSLDGKTLYVTECTYMLAADGKKEHDVIGWINEGKDPTFGTETITTWAFKNGYWVNFGVVGFDAPVQDWGEGKMRYGQNNLGYFTTAIAGEGASAIELMSAPFLNLTDNYYLHMTKEIPATPYKIYAFFDTANDARAYIRKVYSKVERTCQVSR
jgi:hypothetical protein